MQSKLKIHKCCKNPTQMYGKRFLQLVLSFCLKKKLIKFLGKDVDIEALLVLEPTNNSLTESLIPLGGKGPYFLKRSKNLNR